MQQKRAHWSTYSVSHRLCCWTLCVLLFPNDDRVFAHEICINVAQSEMGLLEYVSWRQPLAKLLLPAWWISSGCRFVETSYPSMPLSSRPEWSVDRKPLPPLREILIYSILSKYSCWHAAGHGRKHQKCVGCLAGFVLTMPPWIPLRVIFFLTAASIKSQTTVFLLSE